MFGILLLPFKLIWGLISVIFQFVFGAIGAVFGLIGGLFGLIGGFFGLLFGGFIFILGIIGVLALVRLIVSGIRRV